MSAPVIVNSGTTKCEAVADLLQSIALMQTGVSHIINAEGEILQAAAGTLTGQTAPIAQNINDLVAINQSVESMVVTVTTLQGLLQDNLARVLDVDCTPL